MNLNAGFFGEYYIDAQSLGLFTIFRNSVQSGFYGDFPTFQLDGPSTTDSRGRWIPTIGMDQYGATLATWFGLPAADLNTVFPNLSNFPTANLGFV
jgi:uncharacterized protein (DUF1501 family)